MIYAVLVTTGVLGIVVGFLYTFLTWNFGHWKKLGVKGPKPQPLCGNIPSMINKKRHMADDINDIYNQYKNDEDYVGIFSVRVPQLLILSPELARSIYVTNFKNFHDNEGSTWIERESDQIVCHNPFLLTGENWKKQRQDLIPAFTVARIKAGYPITQAACKKLVHYIKAKIPQVGSGGINGKNLCLRYTTEVVSDCLFGIQSDSLSDEPTRVLAMTSDLFVGSTIFHFCMLLLNLIPSIRKFYKVRFTSKQVERFFMGLMTRAFRLRRESKVDRTDFLNYMLQIKEKRHLNDIDLASKSIAFVLDGCETTASVLIHCLLQLARKPSTQEILLDEIRDNLKDAEDIEFNILQELPYLDQCIHESIRLRIPLLCPAKICTEPIELTNKNGSKLQLKQNDVVIIPVHSFQYDQQIYDNASEFIPERFAPENGGIKNYRDMGAFYPFGDGPRICLGKRFSLVQIKAALVSIIRNFEVKLNPKTRKDNALNKFYFTGELEGGVWLNLKVRE